jgi:tripartite-type tricarboxylate transporter receptor subunit TctC
VIRLAAIATAAATGCAAGAERYPSRPITLNVPYAAGGLLDVVVRIVADGLRATLGQSIVVENVTGTGGSIGVGRAAGAAPDGYTVSTGNWSTQVANGAIYQLPYDLRAATTTAPNAPSSILPSDQARDDDRHLC